MWLRAPHQGQGIPCGRPAPSREQLRDRKPVAGIDLESSVAQGVTLPPRRWRVGKRLRRCVSASPWGMVPHVVQRALVTQRTSVAQPGRACPPGKQTVETRRCSCGCAPPCREMLARHREGDRQRFRRPSILGLKGNLRRTRTGLPRFGRGASAYFCSTLAPVPPRGVPSIRE